MCIIIASKDGKIPKKHLNASLENNKDGWGVMWPENGVLNILNGMIRNDFFRMWKWVKDIPGPKVFHSRISTSGLVDIDNCHPFFVTNHGDFGVAHNGVIGRQANKGESSDTRNFIKNVLAFLPAGFHKEEVYAELLSDYIGWGKLVFMDGDGDITIINEHLGKWVGNIWYSNESYKNWNNGKCFRKTSKNLGSIATIPRSISDCGEVSELTKIALYDIQHSPPCQLPEHYMKVKINQQ